VKASSLFMNFFYVISLFLILSLCACTKTIDSGKGVYTIENKSSKTVKIFPCYKDDGTKDTVTINNNESVKFNRVSSGRGIRADYAPSKIFNDSVLFIVDDTLVNIHYRDSVSLSDRNVLKTSNWKESKINELDYHYFYILKSADIE